MDNKIETEDKVKKEIDKLVDELEEALEGDKDIKLPASGEKGWGN